MTHTEIATEKPLLLLTIVIVAISYAILIYNPELFRETWVTEDGPVEWMTVILLFLLLSVSLHHFVISRQYALAKPQAFYLLTAIFMFFALGEEISWGQRLFQFSTPEFFLEHNAQQEANLHNLKFYGVKLNKALFSKGILLGAILYLLILPYLHSRFKKVQEWIKNFAVPLASKKQIVFIILIVIAIELMPSSKRGEVLECAGILMLLTIFLNPVNKIFAAKTAKAEKYESEQTLS